MSLPVIYACPLGCKIARSLSADQFSRLFQHFKGIPEMGPIFSLDSHLPCQLGFGRWPEVRALHKKPNLLYELMVHGAWDYEEKQNPPPSNPPKLTEPTEARVEKDRI
ncbi:MAG: hypothetical protein KDL87_19355 [Verrucomicrobiae bacterium]|nr:hypothetical protein [Verrucomicrobiae bacterium]